MKDLLSEAIERSKAFLLAQAGLDFRETRHEMHFPHSSGFTGKTELQSSDVFARAVLGSLLIDIADIDEEDRQFGTVIYDIARREAGYIAGSKLKDRAGGWSYFPGLPELPPDADSLAAASLLFTRIAPEYGPLCSEPVGLILDNIKEDGSFETWIISPHDSPSHKKTMTLGIKRYWGSTIDLDVCAHFYLALSAYKGQKPAEAVLKGADYILSGQNKDGSWNSTWYWEYAYCAGLCMDLLNRTGIGGRAVGKAVNFFRDSQRDDGGWGGQQTGSLETALAIRLILIFGGDIIRPSLKRAAGWLIDHQDCDGSWPASNWIKMEVGRADKNFSHTLAYKSITMTTAFCLRSLLLLKMSL